MILRFVVEVFEDISGSLLLDEFGRFLEGFKEGEIMRTECTSLLELLEVEVS